jgi:hypothetical protein
MGNSTVIEFNHDIMHRIFESEESKTFFLAQLENQMKCGYPNYDLGESNHVLGGKVVFFSHRSDWVYKQFIKFLSKLEAGVKKGGSR